MTNRFDSNLDAPVMVNGVMGRQPETGIASLEPRTDGTGSLTVGGTVATGHTLSFVLTSTLFSGGLITIQATTSGSDDASTAAAKLAAAIMANAVLVALGLVATKSATVAGKVDLKWNGPLSRFVTLSGSSTGAETLTLVQFTGGDGPIIPTDDFRFVFQGQIVDFVANRRKQLAPEALALLVAAGPQPIS